MGDFEATGDGHCSQYVGNMLKVESVKGGKFDYHDLEHIGMHHHCDPARDSVMVDPSEDAAGLLSIDLAQTAAMADYIEFSEIFKGRFMALLRGVSIAEAVAQE